MVRSLLKVIAFLVILLACPTLQGGEKQRVGPKPNAFLSLPIRNYSRRLPTPSCKIGTVIPISPVEALTVPHVIWTTEIRPLGPFFFEIETVGRDLEIAGVSVTATTSAAVDEIAVVLRISKPGTTFPQYLNTATPVTGPAWIIRPEETYDIIITDTEKCTFLGWLPIRGNSGSGIVQMIDGEFKIVGILRAKMCDSCSECSETWQCHCADGGYFAKVPKEVLPAPIPPDAK